MWHLITSVNLNTRSRTRNIHKLQARMFIFCIGWKRKRDEQNVLFWHFSVWISLNARWRQKIFLRSSDSEQASELFKSPGNESFFLVRMGSVTKRQKWKCEGDNRRAWHCAASRCQSCVQRAQRTRERCNFFQWLVKWNFTPYPLPFKFRRRAGGRYKLYII